MSKVISVGCDSIFSVPLDKSEKTVYNNTRELAYAYSAQTDRHLSAGHNTEHRLANANLKQNGVR